MSVGINGDVARETLIEDFEIMMMRTDRMLARDYNLG